MRMGYASAMAWVLMVVTLLLTLDESDRLHCGLYLNDLQ